jgi:hypothetical protein
VIWRKCLSHNQEDNFARWNIVLEPTSFFLFSISKEVRILNINEARRVVKVHRKIVLQLEKILLNELLLLNPTDASIDTSARKQVNNIRAACSERNILPELLHERRQLYKEIEQLERSIEKSELLSNLEEKK